MARIALGALNTLNTGTHLDPQFVDLYELRELISSPSYTASSPKIFIASSTFNVGVGGSAADPVHRLRVENSNPTRGMTLLVRNAASSSQTGVQVQLSQSGIGDWAFGQPAAVSAFSIWSGRTTAADGTEYLRINSSGHVLAGTDNTQTLGGASNRWSTVYAGTGTINTSDAREKTSVEQLTEAEIAAARDITREIGGFRFLVAIQEKGDAARVHIGLTVQRAIEIMEAHGLEPDRYAFICHDAWPERVVEHPAEMRAHDSLVDDEGKPIMVEARAAYREVIPAGDRFGFRSDELLLFLARGMEARLTALEQAA